MHYERDFHAGGREGWSVSVEMDSGGPKLLTGGRATIFANETIPNITTVQFVDGKSFFLQGQKRDFSDLANLGDISEKSIGESLIFLSRAIAREWASDALSPTHFPPPSKMEHKTQKILPMEYPGSVAHFRAWMDRYIAHHGNGLSIMTFSEQRDYSVSYEGFARTSTREVWHVTSVALYVNGQRLQDIRRAMILATEMSPNRTVVDFLDGEYFTDSNQTWIRGIGNTSSQQSPPSPQPVIAAGNPIGEDFHQFVNEVRSEFERGNQENDVRNIVGKETEAFQDNGKSKKQLLAKHNKPQKFNLQTKPAGRKVDSWNPVAFDIMIDGNPDAGIRAFNY